MRLHAVLRLLTPLRPPRFVRSLHSGGELMDIAPEVAAALEARRAVVALESTIITHGMPFPKNLQTALKVEQIVRSQGAVPATVAVLGGRVKVGLTPAELEALARSAAATKTSRRDLPHAVAANADGGTTVAATLFVAAAAGIHVFVTGGIGGVHRGGESSMDVSADLVELGRCPVAVVCAGVKAILDIGRTLEFLETQGVCVATVGPSADFPAFYSPRSGLRSPVQAADAAAAARLVHASLQLGSKAGLLLATPIPAEHAQPIEAMEVAIAQALREAADQSVSGKEITPFLLARVSELTGGDSLLANVALIENNALVGAQVAVELSRIQRRGSNAAGTSRETASSATESSATEPSASSTEATAVVVGGSVVDCVISVQDSQLATDGRTHRGAIRQAGGGVGRNLADALAKLGVATLLVSAVGDDALGDFLRTRTLQHLDASCVSRVAGLRTASYACVVDARGDCALGVGDMAAHAQVSPAHHEPRIRAARLVAADGNIGAGALRDVLRIARDAAVPVWFEPTDVQKASKPFETDAWKSLAFVSPNFNELKAMAKSIGVSVKEEYSVADTRLDLLLEETLRLSKPIVAQGIVACVTLGMQGIMIVRQGEGTEAFFVGGTFAGKALARTSARHYAVEQVGDLVNVSGAGDCFAAGFMAAMLRGETEQECVAAGFSASSQALRSVSAVPDVMTLPGRTLAAAFTPAG